jgi:hypothetical protein
MMMPVGAGQVGMGMGVVMVAAGVVGMGVAVLVGRVPLALVAFARRIHAP